ncbi:hypothetical protein [Pseudidiomarina sp.]|uniref:hypothetical protein n=1 Tax=Pseudidiomarina sp. TaxID=2081707 RepID=UPI00299F365F|nr:hypothetical protein [Pseudidiomarina sp.]MDX1704905.1 hypothetical protein [Pseudidiomarina sp.]
MQGDIFQSLSRQDLPAGASPDSFSELCTALYERELNYLAQSPATSLPGLQRRLRSVPYYVQRAARGMLSCDAPYTLDSQNASWQAPQQSRLNRTQSQPKRVYNWLTSSAGRLGHVVPVLDFDPRLQRVVLDSIDRIDLSAERVHLNQYGWFSFQGDCLEPESAHLIIVKPDSSSLKPAFCGHQWNHKGRIDPRTLTLREVLLATTVSW